MTPPSDAAAARLARRYPRRRTPRWLWVPVAAALGAVLLVWATWAGWRFANPDVVAKVVKFKVISATQIDAEVTVQRSDVHTRVTCQVSAQAISYDTVGQLPFTWEPNGQELQTQWLTIKTFKTPVTAVVDWCKVVG